MIYRAKLGLQTTTKQPGTYSPMYSPSNNKKSSVLKQNRFSPKPSQRENKQNIQHKQTKTDRLKQEKYFKISKDQPLSSAKKTNKNSKISISISINQKKKSIAQFDDLNLLNIQTPKFKCSSNKIDDRCKTQHINEQNYFSFGDQFRQNIKLNQKLGSTFFGPNSKKPITPLKEKNRNNNIDQDFAVSQKFSIDALKKKQKMQKIKQTQEKLQQRFLNHDRQVKQSKFKRDRDIFCFKK